MRVILQSKVHSNTDTHRLMLVPPVSFRVKAIYLTSVSIPYTFYNVRSTNNEVIINGVVKYIPPQNYNSIQLAAYLQSILPSGVSVQFNKQKLKYTITNSGVPFSIRFSTSDRLFGFDTHEEEFSIHESHESDFVADINDGLHALILTANFATPFSSLFNNKFGTQIVARIPIENSKGGSMINYSDSNNNRPIAKNIGLLSYFEMNLLDDDLNPLDLNGVDYQIELYLDLETEVTEDALREGNR